jgi:hypothetical protein
MNVCDVIAGRNVRQPFITTAHFARITTSLGFASCEDGAGAYPVGTRERSS